MSVLAPRRVMEVSENDMAYGVCLWRLPNGSYVENDDGDRLSAFGRPGDKAIEQKMRDAVRGLDPREYPGLHEGAPFWLPGGRKISQSEWEDQMDMLLSGAASPDPVDIAKQLGAI